MGQKDLQGQRSSPFPWAVPPPGPCTRPCAPRPLAQRRLLVCGCSEPLADPEERLAQSIWADEPMDQSPHSTLG